MRKNPAVREVGLRGILEEVDESILSELQKANETKNNEKFVTAYKQTTEGVYVCHRASGKPFLCPQIPKTPLVFIINFDPDVKWPK